MKYLILFLFLITPEYVNASVCMTQLKTCIQGARTYCFDIDDTDKMTKKLCFLGTQNYCYQKVINQKSCIEEFKQDDMEDQYYIETDDV